MATGDTDAFHAWFRDGWWPAFHQRYPRPAEVVTREDRIVDYGCTRAPGIDPNAEDHPAHLHIGLLPETWVKGLGRRLIETLFAELRRRGLHLGMDPENAGAAAFYGRLGMDKLPAVPGGQSYGVRFDG